MDRVINLSDKDLNGIGDKLEFDEIAYHYHFKHTSITMIEFNHADKINYSSDKFNNTKTLKNRN